ncbi:uncharacterized protein L3040_005242 [Drepanopeziza brunnea f. sp. 'multigermtubi']|uniref:Carboxypeptidase n=1 Tax=Marssonina brunnea f. sp. multigermtubi (strain MB_m1) TaxID=1072389 RepID=K1WVJ3_MARBU|nr:carboxypeptidase 4 [Drepanopeziza brunnea f. sp. 'multigermtubi' MB_m1]EKD12658.1 carboxypeptidase 4 [Drepanopeziza brunnea f. sp. 'multigermtubi' MB_m1]KAJ5041669.1 hypothetical protein L3040_005242 [Drepanopeziza brunnea f. sp. 'multigermtubi']
MRHFSSALLLLAATALVSALQDPHEYAAKLARASQDSPGGKTAHKDGSGCQDSAKHSVGAFSNPKTARFAVKGNKLPDVNFDIGESYAGTLSVTNVSSAADRLYFWFFPSANPAAKKEIVIWLNGGPGCSSMQGVLQENGPLLWAPGTYEAVPNPYSWTKLTNVVYIDQPVGTGFSQGNVPVNNETDVSRHFLGFWKNFVDTFSLKGYKVYITGESYAGQYIPYIAAAMLDTGDKSYFNVSGIQINDPLINYPATMREVTVIPALERYNNVIPLDEPTVTLLKSQADSCGYTDFHNNHTNNFPPTGPIPEPPSPSAPGCNLCSIAPNCSLYALVVVAALQNNPCFNSLHLTDFCPYLWNAQGYPSLAGGPNNYFNRSDVQRAINAPKTDYYVCLPRPNLFPREDTSLPSGLGPLPSVIERTKNVIIAHGMLDFLLFAEGSLITIQNMTWGGLQGFQSRPSASKNFWVPFHDSIETIIGLVSAPLPNPAPQYNTAGAGHQGTTHSERGLTFVTVDLAGHFMPQYTPGAAFRQLEFLLGRISSLEQRGPYTA